MDNAAASNGVDFLRGDGEMVRLVREKDWANTPLGPLKDWPQSLRTTVSLCLASNFPINLIWGPEQTQIYNDGYRIVCGAVHPQALGEPYSVTWASAWPAVGEPFERALAGETTFLENQRMFLSRNGYLEETFFTFSTSPIRDESGGIGGLFHPVTETTATILAERRTRALRDLNAEIADARSIDAVFTSALSTLSEFSLDLPFCAFYRREPGATVYTLVSQTGIEAGSPVSPLDLGPGKTGFWPSELVTTARSPLRVDGLRENLLGIACGPYEEGPDRAFALPIVVPGVDGPIAIVLAGVSPRLPLDEKYRDFYSLLAAALTGGFANARTYEEERARADELARHDRAKTAFFSNVSHEFRTPLTLMLAPLEDVLDGGGAVPERERERLMVARRNALRLLKLVNSLLDFSRLEAGRVQASFEAVDLGVLTAELASNFRSAFERSGLALNIRCEPLPDSVYVDRDLWEKVVLNLISNAFKFTLRGGVTITLRAEAERAVLTVADTGVGIRQEELPKVFERFYRVEGQRGRTHEGTGIGLALVDELVRLHGGTIDVESAVDRGTTFRITLPFGQAHLPRDRVLQERLQSTATGPNAFVEEALRWLPDSELTSANSSRGGELQPVEGRPRVLLADDNTDMRGYVARILGEGGYEVDAVADGEAALAAARGNRPDLVLSDVMMPILDGFGLLAAIRADTTLEDLSVILLSARAGEEARVEGLQAGADDYLVKPFSARELRARVDAMVMLGRQRREAAATLAGSERRLRRIFETSYQHQGFLSPDGTLLDTNSTSLGAIGMRLPEVVGKPFWATPWFARTPGMPERVRDAIARVQAGETIRQEIHLDLPIGGWRHFDFTIRPVFTEDGTLSGIVPEAVEITDRKLAEEALRQSQKLEAMGQLTGGVAHDFNNLLAPIIGGLDMLQRRNVGGEREQRLIQGALNSADRAKVLVQRLLAFARRQPLQTTSVDLVGLIGGMADLIASTSGPQVRVVVDVAADLPPAHADANQVEMAILNLSVNARDAMPSGGTLTISAAAVEVGAGDSSGLKTGGYVRLAVSDTGIGMSEEVLKHAVEPFFSTKGVGKGTGLGLSMVHGLASQLGGRLMLSSEVGIGTTAELWLPQGAVTPGSAALPGDYGATSSRGTAMLVDDEELVRLSTADMLTDLGYSVIEAASAEQALQMLVDRKIDLLVSDHLMPGMTGEELAVALRSERPNIPVLIISGFAEERGVASNLPRLTKPFRQADLAIALEALH